MEYETLRELNKQFAEDSAQIAKEFGELFSKWIKKCPKTSIIAAIHLPINLIMRLIQSEVNGEVYGAFPNLPEVMTRFLAPFEVIKDQWGKISGKEFAELYVKVYEKQFDSWFPSKEDKEEFLKLVREQKTDMEQKS